MIQGNSNTEATYRSKTIDSASSLKDFSLDRRKYYRRYILSEVIDDKDTQALTMGKVVETLLFEPELFDEKFYLSACASSPTGLMLEFVEALYRNTMAATNEETGEMSKSFEDISKAAYEESGFKIKYEAVIGKFIGSDAEIYYNEILTIRQKNLIVVTANDISTAERIVEELKTNAVTKDILSLVDSKRYEILKQFQIDGFLIDGHPLKAMMDMVIIDHEEKTIQIYDLKCVWAVENFYEEYYLYRRAYIQAYVYWWAMFMLVTDTTHNYYNYKVLIPKFIVCDSINYYNPLIYHLDASDINDAYKGFEYKYREYMGVGQIIKELKWALDNNIWNISMNNYMNNGLVKLKK